MEINPQWGKQERYHVLLIEKYFVLDDLESFETSLERARGLFPESILLKFFTAILLKRTGVNFINILHAYAPLSYESSLRSLSLITVWLDIFLAK